MPLPIYDTQDAVPEDQREDYAEHEAKWHPKAVIELAEERKKRAIVLNEKREEKRLREEAEKKLADADRSAEARAKGISEEELQKIRDAEAKARKPIEEERDRLAAENRKLKLTDRVQALYLGNEGMADRVEDAMDQLAKRTDLGDAGGIVFKDKDGNITTDSPETFFKNFRAEKSWLFKGSGASGSGATGSNGSGGGAPPLTAEAAAQRFNEQRAAMPNPLAPRTAT